MEITFYAPLCFPWSIVSVNPFWVHSANCEVVDSLYLSLKILEWIAKTQSSATVKINHTLFQLGDAPISVNTTRKSALSEF